MRPTRDSAANGLVAVRELKLPRRLAYLARMSGTPSDWNVIVVGSWNLAIFTPAWIAQTLFEVGPDTAVDVQVAFDQAAPMRVSFGGATVIPHHDRLAIVPRQSDIPSLVNASQIAQRALRALPVTPVRAAGVNFRYSFEAVTGELEDVLGGTVDTELDNLEYEIRGRGLRRALKWRSGVLNLSVDEDEQLAARIGLNFDRQSTDRAVLGDWLSLCDEMAADAGKVLKEALKVPAKGGEDEHQD